MKIVKAIKNKMFCEPREVIHEGWINIYTKLPDIGKKVLAFGEGTIFIAYRPARNDHEYDECWNIFNGSEFCQDIYTTCIITHWRPLPLPPKVPNE